jgi:hypothetical protein
MANKTAQMVVGQICIMFHSRNRNVFLKALPICSLPFLHTCVVALDYSRQRMSKEGTVQKRAMKMVPGLKGSSYEQ